MDLTNLHLTTEELAERWHVHPRTLANIRTNGGGCPYIKLGKRVLYPLANVEAFERARMMAATSVKATTRK